MTTIKLTIEYDGSRVSGLFHKEKKHQYRIKAYTGDQGCNRTVHTAFCCHKDGTGCSRNTPDCKFSIRKRIFFRQYRTVKNEIKRALPADIAVTSLEIADERFVASLAVKSCTYTCRIATDPAAALFSRPYTCVVTESLDLKSMQQAAVFLPVRMTLPHFQTDVPEKVQCAL